MTGKEERTLLTDYLKTCERLAKRFSYAIARVEQDFPMTPDRIDHLTDEIDLAALSFIKRFEQFEDALHRTLKVVSKLMEHGKIERLTSRDVTRRAHGLGILPSEKIWADAVRARNTLAHEYPLNPVKRTDQLNTAWDARDVLLTTWHSILRFVEDEGLLRED